MDATARLEFSFFLFFSSPRLFTYKQESNKILSHCRGLLKTNEDGRQQGRLESSVFRSQIINNKKTVTLRKRALVHFGIRSRDLSINE